MRYPKGIIKNIYYTKKKLCKKRMIKSSNYRQQVNIIVKGKAKKLFIYNKNDLIAE